MQYFEDTGMKYWDDFNRRADETVKALSLGQLPPLRRLSLHITQKCNMACEYCNEKHKANTLPEEMAFKIAREYSEMGGGILHITGGEPTTVPYLAKLIAYVKSLGNVKFNLNSNLYKIEGLENDICSVDRLKVSLDTHDANKFAKFTGKTDAFLCVVTNLDLVQKAIAAGKSKTVVSITYTLNKQNYKDLGAFMELYYDRWPDFYAVFFSAYKGKNEEFAFDDYEARDLLWSYVPRMERIASKHNDKETPLLFEHSHEEKTFAVENRFPENDDVPCFVQLSELLIDSSGTLYNCSHLFRDGGSANTGLNIANGHLKDLFRKAKVGILSYPLSHHCTYGCNKKLVTFNQKVHEQAKKHAQVVAG